MTTATIAYVQWPDNLLAHGPEWDAIRRSVDAARADILVTNEMPFGPWAAQHPAFDAAAAARSVELHEKALAALGDLGAGAVISSRPVAFDGRLANEAFITSNISRRKRVSSRKRGMPAARRVSSACRSAR
jgi:N-carbamoylputrescine amidase